MVKGEVSAEARVTLGQSWRERAGKANTRPSIRIHKLIEIMQFKSLGCVESRFESCLSNTDQIFGCYPERSSDGGKRASDEADFVPIRIIVTGAIISRR